MTQHLPPPAPPPPAEPRRGRSRGLLAGGAAAAVLLLVAGAWLALRPSGSGTASRQAAAPTAVTTSAGPSAVTPAGAEGVLDACRTILPALTGFENTVSEAPTPESVLAELSTLRQSIAAAGAGTGDPAFAAHAQQLSDDFGRFGDAVRTGHDPAALQPALTKDGTTVGTDCGLAGWRP